LILSYLHSGEERKELNRFFGRRLKLRLLPLLYAKDGVKPLQEYLVTTGIVTPEWWLGHSTGTRPDRGRYYGDWGRRWRGPGGSGHGGGGLIFVEAHDRGMKEECALLGRRSVRHGGSGWISGCCITVSKALSPS
jgi:hypothetical protein